MNHDKFCDKGRHYDEADHFDCAVGCSQVSCTCEFLAEVRADERERMSVGAL